MATKSKGTQSPAALADCAQPSKALHILKAFDSFDFDPEYDYKAERRGKRS